MSTKGVFLTMSALLGTVAAMENFFLFLIITMIFLILLLQRIKVEIKDDSKTVTVITKKDGEENIEVYEGKAADEYLEKMKSDKEVKVKVGVDKNSSKKKVKKIIIDKQQ